jgi:hypothetical protein
MPPAPLPIATDEAPAPTAAGVLPAAPRPAQPADASVPRATAPHAPEGGALPTADAQRVRAAYRAGEGAAAALAAAGDEAQRMRSERMQPGAAPVAPPAAPLQPGEMIHPQSATMVHQQLDLLATTVFRWSGQAWPQVPMHWSIEEEDRPPHGEEAPAQPRRWRTTVSLALPRLGTVELRLSLAGTAVQAQVVASEAATAGRLRAQGEALGRRFEAAGLRLEALRVSERESP